MSVCHPHGRVCVCSVPACTTHSEHMTETTPRKIVNKYKDNKSQWNVIKHAQKNVRKYAINIFLENVPRKENSRRWPGCRLSEDSKIVHRNHLLSIFGIGLESAPGFSYHSWSSFFYNNTFLDELGADTNQEILYSKNISITYLHDQNLRL